MTAWASLSDPSIAPTGIGNEAEAPGNHGAYALNQDGVASVFGMDHAPLARDEASAMATG